MKKIILLICLLGVLTLFGGCNTSSTQKPYSNQTTNSDNKLEPQKADEDELLYGKYPEPILKAIGENVNVRKDYKELTKGDLIKVVNLSFEREYDKEYISDKYGFKDKEKIDFSILLEMPNLTDLDISFGKSNIKLKDYSILKKLNKLQSLTIGNISDSDIENITGLTSLKDLVICYSNITNINFLEHLNQLDFFMLNNVSTIHNYEPLRNLKKIRLINLVSLGMTEKELSTLPDMKSVVNIGLNNNNIKRITCLPNIPNLEGLVLSNNPITSISISNTSLPKLKQLDLRNTEISDLNKLKGLDNIEWIFLNKTNVKKIAPLINYKNLRYIIADLNNIEDKEKLKGTGIEISQDY